jgi:hypothetical protein
MPPQLTQSATRRLPVPTPLHIAISCTPYLVTQYSGTNRSTPSTARPRVSQQAIASLHQAHAVMRHQPRHTGWCGVYDAWYLQTVAASTSDRRHGM